MTILPKSKKNDSKKGESKKNAKPNSPNKVETSSVSSSSKHVPSSSKQHAQHPLETERAENLNSDDEHCEGFRDDELELRFAERLKNARGFLVKEVIGDGACMFRAVADQVYGDEEMHSDVRTLCMDYIAKNRDHFSQFLTEDFDEYLTRKREVNAHGNHVELQAISEIFSRPIEIYEYSIDPINTFHPITPEANTGVDSAPLRLSYHGTVHYNSVIDPFAATVGVGLGLPGYQPGLADQNLMREATIASETQHIEEAMLNDKLRMTDWERTEEELSKQIAKKSYMEYLRQLEEDGGASGSDAPPPSKAARTADRPVASSSTSVPPSRPRPISSSPITNDGQKPSSSMVGDVTEAKTAKNDGGVDKEADAQPSSSRFDYDRLAEEYAAELAQMHDCGFTNDAENVRLLYACDGRVDAALELAFTVHEQT